MKIVLGVGGITAQHWETRWNGSHCIDSASVTLQLNCFLFRLPLDINFTRSGHLYRRKARPAAKAPRATVAARIFRDGRLTVPPCASIFSNIETSFLFCNRMTVQLFGSSQQRVTVSPKNSRFWATKHEFESVFTPPVERLSAPTKYLLLRMPR